MNERRASRAADTWLPLCDDLLWGFSHAFSNRLAAISSLTRILEYSDTGADPLLTALSEEVRTLEETLRLLQLVPGTTGSAAAEPIHLPDLVSDLLALHRLRRSVREIPYDIDIAPETPPVLAEPSALTHGALVLLDAVSKVAMESGGAPVRLTTRGEETEVTLAFATSTNGTAVAAPERVIQAAGVLLESAGGNLLDRTGGGDGVLEIEIRLPALTDRRG